jgi:hypothetical protein
MALKPILAALALLLFIGYAASACYEISPCSEDCCGGFIPDSFTAAVSGVERCDTGEAPNSTVTLEKSDAMDCTWKYSDGSYQYAFWPDMFEIDRYNPSEYAFTFYHGIGTMASDCSSELVLENQADCSIPGMNWSGKNGSVTVTASYHATATKCPGGESFLSSDGKFSTLAGSVILADLEEHGGRGCFTIRASESCTDADESTPGTIIASNCPDCSSCCLDENSCTPYTCQESETGYECIDAFDNDCDGKADCWDSDCADTEHCPFMRNLSIKLNPEYKEEASRPISEDGRGATFNSDTDFSPLDNIDCELIVYPPQGKREYMPLIEEKEPFVAFLISPGEEPFTLGFAEMERVEGDFNYALYRWTIQGWPNGWLGSHELEKLVRNGKVKCAVTSGYLKEADPQVPFAESQEYGFRKCVHLWGSPNAKFNVVNMYGSSAEKTPGQHVNRAKTAMEAGFKSISPFSDYVGQFSFKVGLVEHDDSEWPLDDENYFKSSVDKKVRKLSSCGQSPGTYYVFNSSRILAGEGQRSVEHGYTKKGGNVIYLSTIFYPGAVDVHEMGHALCRLNDEYLYEAARFSIGWGSRNCVRNPSSFGAYGETTHEGCDKYTNFFRPSETSIMLGVSVAQFNVVSCGYCLAEIKGTGTSSAVMKKNFEECMEMDGVIKPGVA